MTHIGYFLLAIAVGYSIAVVTGLLHVRIPGARCRCSARLILPLILATPLLIPADGIPFRAAAAFLSLELAFKCIDFFRQWDQLDRRIVLREFLRFLIPFPVLDVVYPNHRQRQHQCAMPRLQVIRLLGGVAGFSFAVVVLKSLNRTSLIQSHVMLNHALLVVMFVVAIESLSQALWSLERLAGYDTRPVFQKAFLSRTVSEFWQRYNCRVHDWLYWNIFVPSGGRRTPARSILLVFLFSGLFHELMFTIATSRLTGYQLAFFTLQGPAVLLSGRLDRLARRAGLIGRVVSHGFTILFVAGTSVLFFDGVARVFPLIYAGQPPLP